MPWLLLLWLAFSWMAGSNSCSDNSTEYIWPDMQDLGDTASTKINEYLQTLVGVVPQMLIYVQGKSLCKSEGCEWYNSNYGYWSRYGTITIVLSWNTMTMTWRKNERTQCAKRIAGWLTYARCYSPRCVFATEFDASVKLKFNNFLQKPFKLHSPLLLHSDLQELPSCIFAVILFHRGSFVHKYGSANIICKALIKCLHEFEYAWKLGIPHQTWLHEQEFCAGVCFTQCKFWCERVKNSSCKGIFCNCELSRSEM